MKSIALYQEGTLSSGIASQNQLYSSMISVLTGQAKFHPEERKAIEETVQILDRAKMPVHASETRNIGQEFNRIVQDIKNTGPDAERQAAFITKSQFAEMIKSINQEQQSKDLQGVSAEQVARTIVDQMDSVIDVPEPVKDKVKAIEEKLQDDIAALLLVLREALQVRPDDK